MKTRFKYFTYAIVLVAIVNSNSIFAQTSRTDPNDNQGWYGAKLKLDLPSGWETSLDYQARFINDFNMYNGSYTTIGAAKKIAKHIELQGDFRLALVEKGTYYRGSFGFEASNGFGDFDFGLRMLVQNQLQDFDDEYKDNQRDGYWRVKLETNYAPTDGIQLYVSTEPIMKFGGVRPIDNWRNIAGVKIKVAKRTKLNLFYMYRPDFAKATYNRLFQVVGVNLDYTLKIKKSNPSGHYLIAK
ncbi:MAG: hypothetical protein RL074_512 [Bacteroidota bacterium]|jgi:hypothetical protein